MPSAARFPITRLTDTHCAILQLVADGHTNREIAEQLNYSYEHTKLLAAQAIQFLGARNRTHAAALGMYQGIIR